MKISMREGENKGFLPDGRHVVEIMQIDEGTSEYKEVPFINCRFENDEGFVNHRFYLSQQGRPILLQLMRAAGVDFDEKSEVDTKTLKGKKVSIEVRERTYDDPQDGHTKTIKEAAEFREAGNK